MGKKVSNVFISKSLSKTFISDWSKVYKDTNEAKYEKHIKSALNKNESFIELFKWKNGTGNKIAGNKSHLVKDLSKKRETLHSLQGDFDWSKYEEIVEPDKNAPIWKIFLLHLIKPNHFPIFDQHVYRCYKFFANGIIAELPSKSKEIYLAYRKEYLPWFNRLKNELNFDHRTMDKAFFAFGKTLKDLEKKPHVII